MELSDHLFRREAGRMVATLTRIFGVQNLALAEDVVQDAFCRALEVWKFRGLPENPSDVAYGHRKEPRSRRPTARTHRAHLRARAGTIARKRMDHRPHRRGAFWSNRDQRRSASDDVLLLPSPACGGSAGR